MQQNQTSIRIVAQIALASPEKGLRILSPGGSLITKSLHVVSPRPPDLFFCHCLNRV